ncbi:MAG: Tm-1-like ATP-binding domain-containing protein [Deltaproteobacteria bacterium]|nr:Tm-1-like ATP-binding domain-containing protein [Deltaproteobacteria bacterium]MBW2344998.1 Tm-1-like ATP-binding domain-containing protein [Deltaproteobacteria bacterium]
MEKKIVIIGTVNTKGDQLGFLKERIESRGHKAILMDISMGGRPAFQADITPEEIAGLAGKNIEEIRASKDRLTITNAMTAGAQQKALDLLSQDKLHGIVVLGGVTMALIGSQVMSGLPFGIPKVIATPAAMPAYVGKWFGDNDIIVMQLIMEVAGMNDLLKNAISQVAGAISGMVDEADDYKTLKLPYPSVAVTQLGFSDQCAMYVEQFLTEKGYHVYPFHAQGISDRAMDRLISQGFFDSVIEIVPAGLIEERFKGNRSAGMARLDAAGERGIPQVWAPCCLNITGAGITRTNREKYLATGKVLEIDEMRAMARFPRDELLIGAQLYAEKLNKAKGPIKLVVPLRGWSSLEREGSPLLDPEEDQVFIEELKKNLRIPLEIEEVDCNLEDIDTARALVESLDTYMKEEKK